MPENAGHRKRPKPGRLRIPALGKTWIEAILRSPTSETARQRLPEVTQHGSKVEASRPPQVYDLPPSTSAVV